MINKVVLIVFFAGVLASCKKDYVCECTTTPGNTKTEYTIKGVSKSRAKANCVSTSQEVDTGSSTVVVNEDCKLK